MIIKTLSAPMQIYIKIPFTCPLDASSCRLERLSPLTDTVDPVMLLVGQAEHCGECMKCHLK